VRRAAYFWRPRPLIEVPIDLIKPGREEDGDSLNHWRFYGEDGKGAAIAVPMATLTNTFSNSLYAVDYGIDSRGGGSNAANRPVRQIETSFKDRLNALPKGRDKAIAGLHTAIEVLHPLLFLFKSASWAAEREVRSLVHAPGYGSTNNIHLDDRAEGPGRAYVDSASGVVSNGSIIYFGPKCDPAYAIELMHLAQNANIDVRVLMSALPYR